MRIVRNYMLMLLSLLAMLLGMQLLSVSAAGVKLYDESGTLSPSQLTECEDRLNQAADHTGMNIGVVIGLQYRSDLTIESLCDASYDEVFGHKTDGLFYYMDLKGENPYDYISTSGLGQMYYTNSSQNNRINEMFSDLDTYLYPVGSEDVYGAVMRFAELVEYYYDAGVPDRYYVYDDEYHEYYHMENGKLVTTNSKPYHNWVIVIMFTFFGAFGGLIAALITFAAVKTRYRFKYALSPTNYVNRKNVRYNEQYDKFVRTSTSRVRIESDSGGRSGGGGGGGGGHSSGGHGGGGHHR